MKRQDGFMRGAGGVFKCLFCGKNTRATNETLGLETCPVCYEIGGLQNSLSDGNITVAEFFERCEAIAGFDRDIHIDESTQSIIDQALEEEAR